MNLYVVKLRRGLEVRYYGDAGQWTRYKSEAWVFTTYSAAKYKLERLETTGTYKDADELGVDRYY